MKIKSIPCKASNYGGAREADNIRYLVIHYTAGRNDTAENNGIYFSRNNVGASAHYFVDENEVVQSVPDKMIAWHCGANKYYHANCRNSNSLGVEICTKQGKDGIYYFDTNAMDRAAVLSWYLMERYQIPLDHVVRHYDVTHKNCPAPMVGDGGTLWKLFKERIMEVPDRIFEDVPSDAWYADSVAYCAKTGLMNGVSDEEFEPYRSVTRAELAAILYRLSKK